MKFLSSSFFILWALWMLWVFFNMFQKPDFNDIRQNLLDEIKKHDFKGKVIKKQKFKRVLFSIQTKSNILETYNLSDELIKITEVGDSIYKWKGVNCCLIVGKNKKVQVPYIISSFLSNDDYVSCSSSPAIPSM